MPESITAELNGAGAPGSPFDPLAADDPAVIGGYQLRARLGAGGMGRVYLAFTPGGRALAVKVVRREFAEDPEFRGRFAQEIRAAQRVNGVYTAQVVDAGPDAEQPWLATAYVPGPSLAAAVRQFGPLPVRTVLLLTGAVAESLAAIHAASVVHRDLKPANVVLAEDGPRVIDFGIARAGDSTPLTATGIRIGTPQYMAPEQALGQSAEPATDLFSLGSLAFYAATGRTPFGDGQEMAVLYRVVNEKPDLSACPPELLPVVEACLTKDPAERITGPALIDLCRQLAGGDLRITAGWLPTAVSSEATRRTVTAPPAPAAAHAAQVAQVAQVVPDAGAASTATAAQPVPAAPTYIPAAAELAAHMSPAHISPAQFGAAQADARGLTQHIPQQGQHAVGPVNGPVNGPAAVPAAAQAFAAPSGVPSAGPSAAPSATQSPTPPTANLPIGFPTAVPPPPTTQAGSPKPPNWGRRLLLGALVVVLLVGGGAIAAVSLDGKSSTSSSDGQNQQPNGSAATGSTDLGDGQPNPAALQTLPPNLRPATAQPTAADPTDTTIVDNGDSPGTMLGTFHIDLPQGYGFNLTSDLTKPNTAVLNDDGVNFDVDYPSDVSYFEASTTGATLAILQPGTPGSYQNCLGDTQYVGQMELSDLSVGTEICDITPRGRVALMRITHLPSESDPSIYVGFDITSWQGIISTD